MPEQKQKVFQICLFFLKSFSYEIVFKNLISFIVFFPLHVRVIIMFSKLDVCIMQFPARGLKFMVACVTGTGTSCMCNLVILTQAPSRVRFHNYFKEILLEIGFIEKMRST